MDRRTFFMSAGGAALLAASGGVQVAFAAGGKAKIAPWGFDIAGMDRSVKPGDDFARYSGGTWLKNNQIPADRSRWGSFDVLSEQATADVKAICEELGKKGGKPGTNEQKIGDYYASYLDVAAIEAKGLEPIKPLLDKIAAAKSPSELAVLAATPGVPTPSPIVWGIGLDQKDPDRYAVTMSHAGLGLPNRDFYIGPKAKPQNLADYKAHIAKLLGLAKIEGGDAKAEAIVSFETAIAYHHWLPEQRRDRSRTYNPKSRADLKAMAPSYPWDDAFAAGQLDTLDRVIVREEDSIGPLADLWAKTPLDTLKAYSTYHALRSSADVLPKAFDDEVFDFFGHKLNGQPQQRDRWKRAVAATSGALGEAIGKIYVARHFPPASKKQMQELVENLRAAYGERIRALTWMSDDTKKVALEKLAAFRPKIGYPDKWRDYSKLEVVRGDAAGNAQRAQIFEYNRDVARLNDKTDRDEWGMTPQTVNAYYNSTFNEVVFPAAILQPPFFDPNADPAVNYGGIVAVIGHEMGHGFDDQGAKSDAKGVLHDWWKPEDVASFKKLTDSLADQYSKFEALPGVFVNGRLTLGENIGDNGGMQVAYRAYQISLKGKPAPVLDGFTGDQRFFLGWAQVWRSLARDEALRNQVLTDPHSPGMFRANGPERNMDAWYKAFDVKPGDKNYLPPEQRVQIW